MVTVSQSRIVRCLVAAGLFLSTGLFPQSQTQVGYTTVSADTGSLLPVGAALFSFSNPEGVLVSQAGVAASSPIPSGRIFVDESNSQTGIALVNPSSLDASVSLVLRDASGSEVSRKSLSLAAGRHLPTFVFQQFPGLPTGFTGSLSFDSSQKLAAITLRQSLNRRGEPLYTTLPVADLAASPSSDPLLFPQIAAGDGYSTQLILINTTTQTLTGRLRFTAGNGSPLSLRLASQISSDFLYQIPPHGTFKAELDRPAGLAAGYALVSPDPGKPAPSGSAVFQFKSNGFTVTEAGVGASLATTSARIFVDNVGTYTGVALANAGGEPAEVLFTLLDPSGFTLETISRTLAARGHTAVFAHELFPAMAGTFTGLMEIRSRVPVNPITLKLTLNQKNEQILTTLPVADMTRPPAASSAVFPQIAIGGGFTTRLIFINTSTSNATAGRLGFVRSDGTAMILPVAGRTASEFPYRFIAGAGWQYLPGDSAVVARILLVDPESGVPASEIVVNEGNSVPLRAVVLDITGATRDDFQLSYSSLNAEIASIDSFGVVRGKSAGFSTVTATAGGVVVTGTITVVKVDSGVPGYEIQGIAQDQARRLYLAATQQHTILLAQNLNQTPDVYAGKAQQAGLKDDLRKDALFRNPSYIAFNQADATLYVSEIGNHVIRRVKPGPSGRVDTLAGTGTAGSKDGPAKEASFRSPRGVAMDGRGYLWIADTGNHTIRRVNLITGVVDTVAGSAGSSGTADGTKSQARFSSPSGVAVEFETLGQQLEREAKGFPPPPVTVIVADEGSGLIRRVSETGEVRTIATSGTNAPGAPRTARDSSPVAATAAFSGPTGVAVDPSGNIFVAEAATGAVKTILLNGSVVPSVQQGTFASPRGIAAVEGGRLVVAESQRFAREVSYGAPRITSITPPEISIRGGELITIKGANFSRETLVVLRGTILKNARIVDTQTITFTSSAMPSGLTTLSIQNRGGLAQTSVLIAPPALEGLAAGHVTTVAGGGNARGDGAPAVSAAFQPYGLAMSSRGDLFVSDYTRIRRIDASSGIVTTVAGTGETGARGEDVPATSVPIYYVQSIALDPAGNLLAAEEHSHRVCRISAATGLVRTIAGNGTSGYSGDNGLALTAQFAFPQGIAVDAVGHLYIADRDNDRVRRVDALTGIVTTVAGSGKRGFSGDGGPALSAELNRPSAVAVGPTGDLFISDSENNRIRKVEAGTGIIRTVAGNGTRGTSGDGGPATAAQILPALHSGMSVDRDGNLYLTFFPSPAGSDPHAGVHRVRKVDAATGFIATVAGIEPRGFSGDGGPATAAALNLPTGVLVDSAGDLLISDYRNFRIRKVAVATGIIRTFAGMGSREFPWESGRAIAGTLPAYPSIAADTAGNLFVADPDNARIWKVDAVTGLVSAFAGNGTRGYSGAGGPAVAASVSLGTSSVRQDAFMAAGPSGDLYFFNDLSLQVFKVNAASGLLSIVAGNRSRGATGDGGPAAAASLDPGHLALDPRANLFILTMNRVRKVDATSGVITTVAGTGEAGYSGDGGPATNARFDSPGGLAADAAGNLYVADTGNNRIRKIEAATGVITTIAGDGTRCTADYFRCLSVSGDGGPVSKAVVSLPTDLMIDGAGNVIFVEDFEFGRRRLRRIDAATGVLTHVGPAAPYIDASTDGWPFAEAAAVIYRVAMGGSGNVYITGGWGLYRDRRIRAIRGPIP